jgi:hypothetical protein
LNAVARGVGIMSAHHRHGGRSAVAILALLTAAGAVRAAEPQATEVIWNDGKPVRTADQFGLGRKR